MSIQAVLASASAKAAEEYEEFAKDCANPLHKGLRLDPLCA